MKDHTIVQKIWGEADTVLFIFAGCAAEFSVNKAVDWLYFTNKLPNDPLGRLFDTVAYAQKILFQDEQTAVKTIQKMNLIHQKVAQQREASIPQWAFRDVLYMLIDYSIKSYELTSRKLTLEEKEVVFEKFRWVGEGMHIENLPLTFAHWQIDREKHMQENLQYSAYSQDLYKQYKKHLGSMRYTLLIELQQLLLPTTVKRKLALSDKSHLKLLIPLYQILRHWDVFQTLQMKLMPSKYVKEIKQLNQY